MSRILVLDCGSSALKATLFGSDGAVIASAEASYPAAAPHRRDPEHWWEAAVEAVARLPREDVVAISLTGTMENLIALGADGCPAGEAIVYSDPAGSAALAQYAARLEEIDATRILGNAPEPLMTAFKLKWLEAEQPQRFASVRTILPGSKDFLALKLTGVAATDPSCASTTGLMDIGSRDWSGELLELLGIDRALLPPILPAGTALGGLSGSAAAALGLSQGIPVFNGCGDGAATTIGSGSAQPDTVSIYLGTSGWVAGVTATTDREPRPYYRLAHPLHGGLIEIAPILSAGAAAQWARDALGLDLAAAEAAAEEADRAPGSALFLPYLEGERSPFVDLELRAGFAGVSSSDGSGALYHAVLEGVALAVAANVQAMGVEGEVFLVGGGARSATWAQIVADVLDREVSVPAEPVLAASLGAWRIAAEAMGLEAEFGSNGRRFAPRPERRGRMAQQRAAFEVMTKALRGLKRAV